MTFDLQAEVSSFEELFKSFEKLLKLSERLYKGDNHVVYALCELYAMMGAHQILACIGATNEIEIASVQEETERPSGTRGRLPRYENVQEAARELLAAVALVDKAGMSSALEAMGVLTLCPVPEQQFSRMELVSGGVKGRAPLVFLVELSLFAAELGDFERAHKYAREARIFNPSSWELYKLCVVEGLVALNAGRVDEAVHCLARSMTACQADEYSSLHCSIRVPVLVLAEKLLEHGERVEVLRHLLDCQNVWHFLRPQIEEWISLIEDGERPDFREAKSILAMNQASHRLNTQWMSACSLEEGAGSATPKSTIPMSPAEVLAGRERLGAEYRVHRNAAIKSKLQYLDRELTAPPDHPPPNPADPSPPSSSDPAA